MKKFLMLFSLLVLGFSLVGCDKNLVTHRTVDKMNETTKVDYYKSDFINLDGRTVVRIKKDNNDGTFKCMVTLSNGSISVRYVDSFKKETILFTINKDETIDKSYGYINANSSGYLVIETKEIASGNIYISWN